jgi:DNA-binding FadR family transcriptional regulator
VAMKLELPCVERAVHGGDVIGVRRGYSSRRRRRKTLALAYLDLPLYLNSMQRDVAQEAVFKPVRPPTTFEETVERLGTAIRLGLLPAGSRLPAERSLAEELGISRSTLRQALTTLVQSGHLVSLRGRTGGTFVAERPPLAADSRPVGEKASAIVDYRVAIETGATILAAERAGLEHLDQLDELVERMASADKFEEYRRADIRFHIGVAEAAHSPRLVGAMTEVQGQMSDLIALIAHPEAVLTHSNEQHRRLVQLLRSGNAVGAVGLVRDHIEGTEHILAGLI